LILIKEEIIRGIFMKFFSVPADFKKQTIDAYEILNNTYNDSKVIETYGQITEENIFGSGRPSDVLNKVDINILRDYIEYSRQKNIDFNYTLNSSCIGNREYTKEGIYEIKCYLDKLYKAGVRSLTIAMPSLIEIVRTLGYDFKIKASAICQISNASKALSYKKMGVDRMVVDIPIHRDFQALKSIRNAFGEKVEIIVNTMCHKNCIYSMFHYNESSHDFIINADKSSINYYPYRCVLRCHEDNSNFIKTSWIRPEDLKYYSMIDINYFKIQGRQVVAVGDPVKTVESYFKESYDGNLMDLLRLFSPTNPFNIKIDNKKLEGYLKPFFDIPHFCKNDCLNCNYCTTFSKKCIDSDESKEKNIDAINFYNGCDEFKNNVKEVMNQTLWKDRVEELTGKAMLDFDFDLDVNEDTKRGCVK
jgi:collagenase-like PrtC family protease